ncbi:MAG TPA: VWA domain-containing protein [Candidatus Acidoferrales bacterium]|nr:VWA domain-containing protein [Candidatus Acidoferrales bacterium]
MADSTADNGGAERRHFFGSEMVMLRIILLSAALIAGAPAGAQSSNPQHATPGVPAQQRPGGALPQESVRSRIVSRTNLVLVPVTVKDGRGQLVAGLQRNDFEIFEDGAEQQIILFDSNPFPLSAVVLVDNDLSNKQAKEVQKSLISISAGFGPGDEVALMKYSAYPDQVSDFSSNNDALFTQLKRLEISSHSTAIYSDPATTGPVINGQPLPTGQGVPLHGSARPANNNALDDAIFAAGQMLKGRGRDRRKIIFLVSDGSNSRHNQHTFDETLRFLLESDISVYSISVAHSIPGKSILQHGLGQADRYAVKTGGDTFYAGREEDLDRLYSEVTEEARNQYTLTFSPRNEDKTRDYHTIEVRIRRPGLDVSARDGYYTSALGIAH